MTYVLIAANLAMFGVELAMGADPMAAAPPLLVDLGGNFPPRTLHGEWWRLASAMFLHGNVIHLGVNMLSLYRLRAAEAMFGRLGFAVLYILAGLGGGIANLLMAASNSVTVGASGALFGIFGAYGVLLVLRRARFAPEMWQKAISSFGQVLILNLIVSVAVRSISLSGHVGGFVVGAAVGAALLAGAGADQARTRRALWLAAIGIALTAVAMLSLHAPTEVQPLLARFDAVERTATKALAAAVDRHVKHELSDAEFTAIIDRDVLAPYRDLQRALLARRSVSERLQPLMTAADRLIAARLRDAESLEVAATEHEPARRTALFEAHKRDTAEVTEDVAAVTAELERLKQSRDQR